MKLKKLAALLLCLLLAITLAACGDDTQSDDPANTDQPSTPPKSDYQQAYDKALTAFYLPEGIWQLQLLDEQGNTGTEATVYLRFNRAETETLCSTTLAEDSNGRLNGAVSHTTTATNTTTTTMRISGSGDYYVELALSSIDIGSHARYNVTYTAHLSGSEISVPALLQPLKESDPLLPVAEYQLSTYQLDLGGTRLDNYGHDLRGQIWATVAEGLPVVDGKLPQVIFKGYEDTQYTYMHGEKYALYPADDTKVITWFGFDADGKLTQDAARACCYVLYLADASADMVTDHTSNHSPLYGVTDGGGIQLYGGGGNDDTIYSIRPFARVILEEMPASKTDYLQQLQTAAKNKVDENHYYVLMQPYQNGMPEYLHLAVAEVENGSVVRIYDPMTGLFFYEK